MGRGIAYLALAWLPCSCSVTVPAARPPETAPADDLARLEASCFNDHRGDDCAAAAARHLELAETPPNRSTPSVLYERGCEYGHLPSCLLVARFYEHGERVGRFTYRSDSEMAAHAYSRACELGDGASCGRVCELRRFDQTTCARMTAHVEQARRRPELPPPSLGERVETQKPMQAPLPGVENTYRLEVDLSRFGAGSQAQLAKILNQDGIYAAGLAGGSETTQQRYAVLDSRGNRVGEAISIPARTEVMIRDSGGSIVAAGLDPQGQPLKRSIAPSTVDIPGFPANERRREVDLGGFSPASQVALAGYANGFDLFAVGLAGESAKQTQRFTMSDRVGNAIGAVVWSPSGPTAAARSIDGKAILLAGGKALVAQPSSAPLPHRPQDHRLEVDLAALADADQQRLVALVNEHDLYASGLRGAAARIVQRYGFFDASGHPIGRAASAAPQGELAALDIAGGLLLAGAPAGGGALVATTLTADAIGPSKQVDLSPFAPASRKLLADMLGKLGYAAK